MAHPRALFMTGATGYIGSRVLAMLLERLPALEAFVLLRESSDWESLVRDLGPAARRCTYVRGDLVQDGFALTPGSRDLLTPRVDLVIHAAADTSFSQPLDHARLINVGGSQQVVAFARACPRLTRLVHISTAFVAGASTGRILETEAFPGPWVNAYEQSKHEAERAIQASSLPWLILRPSTVVSDDSSGRVSQLGAVHRALRLYHSGLAALMPGTAETPVDLVTREYVARAVVDLSIHPDTDRGLFHLCAGNGALTLGRLLETSHRVWSEVPEWKRRGIDIPALADLPTYRKFEASVAATGNARVRAITEALTHFVPQLAYPKTFETRGADSALGYAAEPVRTWWPRVVRHLVRTRWNLELRRAG